MAHLQMQSPRNCGSHWFNWSVVHGAFYCRLCETGYDMSVLKSPSLKPATKEEKGLIYDTSQGDNSGNQLTRTPSPKVALINTNNYVSNQCQGLNM